MNLIFIELKKFEEFRKRHKKKITLINIRTSDYLTKQKMDKILIGTNNNGKLEDWKIYLKEYDIISPKEINLNLNIEEDMISLENNAIKKAKTFAKASGIMTLSDDTGFFMDELDGKPGVAIKRWAGELPEEVSDDEFLEFFRKKIESMKNTSCYIENIIVIAKPNGEYRSIKHKTEGHIDKSRLNNPIIKNYPLSASFVKKGRNKTWNEMSEKEKILSDMELVVKVKKVLEEFLF